MQNNALVSNFSLYLLFAETLCRESFPHDQKSARSDMQANFGLWNAYNWSQSWSGNDVGDCVVRDMHI